MVQEPRIEVANRHVAVKSASYEGGMARACNLDSDGGVFPSFAEKARRCEHDQPRLLGHWKIPSIGPSSKRIHPK